MADVESTAPDAPRSRWRSRLETIQLGVTIAIAILGGWLSIRQNDIADAQLAIEAQQRVISNQLHERQQRHEERIENTLRSAELLVRAKQYLDVLGLDAEKSRRILISLLEIEKDLRISKTGEITEVSDVNAAVDVLPHHLALLAGDSESLAHIGATQQELALWIPIAEMSGDIDVRKAAIDALEKIGRISRDTKVIEMCVDSIIALTQSWNVADLRALGADAISRLAEFHSSREIGGQEELNLVILNAIREIEGANVAGDSPQDAVAEGAPSGGPAEVAQAEEPVERIAAIRELREQYQARSVPEPRADALTELIAELDAEDTRTRRLARSKIGERGAAALPKLLEALGARESSYRVRVGVATSLMLMAQPLELDASQLRAIVPLLGDPDKTVRTNIAQFLGQLTHRATLEEARLAVTAAGTNGENFGNGTFVYNCVIVLLDWLKWNEVVKGDPALVERIGRSLRSVEAALERDDRSWSSTRARIREGLAIVQT